MKRIYFDIGLENVIYIRYNPDRYMPSYGKEMSDIKRHEYLVKKIKKYIQEKPKYPCTVIYLFYDGFTELETEEEILDPYSEDNLIYWCIKCKKLYPVRYFTENFLCEYCK